jgi:two-component system response regulator FlrC
MNIRAQIPASEPEALAAAPAPSAPSRSLMGQDPVACAEISRRLMELARRVASSDCTVLIAGESGTGKEVLARYIHRHSRRARGPFVAVNCAAIPDHLLEGLLFGWERGAFTGAQAAHAGKFEQAQSGTLLLDEVGEIPLSLQAKLLRALQEREVERLGARAPISLDVRVLATTNRPLRAEVAAGRFREDLYYRLNVFPLTPLPLRRRREDVLPLAMRSIAVHSRPGARLPALHPDAAQRLLTHAWPGNVRELENVMQRALVLCDGELIRAEHIVFEAAVHEGKEQEARSSEATQASAGGTAPTAASTAEDGGDATEQLAEEGPLVDALALVEQKLIIQALRRHGSRELAAAKLGISARTLRYKLARLRAVGVDLTASEDAA